MSKNIKILFTVSILLNVLLLGLSGGMASGWMRWHEWNKGDWDSVKSNLSPETHSIMEREFQDMRRSMKELGRESREARENIASVLSQPDYSEAALDDALQRLEAAQRNIMDHKIAATKKLVAEVSVEDRRKMAEHLSRSLSGKYGPYFTKGHEKHDYPRPRKAGEDGAEILNPQ
jgi:uncharacterized membrane protein